MLNIGLFIGDTLMCGLSTMFVPKLWLGPEVAKMAVLS